MIYLNCLCLNSQIIQRVFSWINIWLVYHFFFFDLLLNEEFKLVEPERQIFSHRILVDIVLQNVLPVDLDSLKLSWLTFHMQDMWELNFLSPMCHHLFCSLVYLGQSYQVENPMFMWVPIGPKAQDFFFWNMSKHVLVAL